MKKLNLFLFGLFMVPGLCSNVSATDVVENTTEEYLDLGLDPSGDMLAEYRDGVLKQYMYEKWKANSERMNEIVGVTTPSSAMSLCAEFGWIINLPPACFHFGALSKNELIEKVGLVCTCGTNIGFEDFVSKDDCPVANFELCKHWPEYEQKELEAIDQMQSIVDEIKTKIPPLMLPKDVENVLRYSAFFKNIKDLGMLEPLAREMQLPSNGKSFQTYYMYVFDKIVEISKIADGMVEFFAS